jgi:non-heme chloroperoxidase
LPLALLTVRLLKKSCCQTHPEIVNPGILAFVCGEDVKADQQAAAASAVTA